MHIEDVQFPLRTERESPLQEHSLHMATLAKNSSVAFTLIHYYRIFLGQALFWSLHTLIYTLYI